MALYYVNNNAQTTGEHEVHKDGCSKLLSVISKQLLGNFNKCQDAVNEAKKYHANVDGCYYCSYECHKK